MQIDLERRLPAEQLDRFVEDPTEKGPADRSMPERPVVIWHVSGVPETGIHRYWRGQRWSGTVALDIGEFPAIAGRSYSVTTTVTRPAPWAQAMNPHVQVAISSLLWTYYYVGAMALVVSFMVGCGIAAGCLFASWASRRGGKVGRAA